MMNEQPGMNILEIDNTLVNMFWFVYADIRKVQPDADDPDEYYYNVTFYFADGRGAQTTVKVGEEGLDTIREAMI